MKMEMTEIVIGNHREEKPGSYASYASPMDMPPA
jgi:hypothetical protein